MTADADTIVSPQRNNAAGYRYQHGDRPLDGYTIQRGAGRGGFGEVYYALSDSGREVALKVVHTYEQIELRGIGQCMNLKSPHLVTIFDVKYGDDGRPWVIMEFVSGPSLRELLDAAPTGLGVQKAAFFLREIGKGLTELHDCGIVHRDLKPANIFFENGYVKIGDYGLSKLISASQHSGQTMTVGTVHYMAPEIGAGKYNRQIDIYAMGALLYEMLTGQVPYIGSSPAEVLMKHLSGNMDTTGIEEPFATVIRKAMAKDPDQRYASVQEMVEAVFGAEHIRNSVSQFSADNLTMVAGQAARKISGADDGTFTPSDTPVPFPHPRSRFEQRFERIQQRVKDRCDRAERKARGRFDKLNRRFGFAPARVGDSFQRTSLDPMRLGQRIPLAAVVMALCAVGAVVLNDHGPEPLFFVFLTVSGATTALMLGWHFIAPGLKDESPWLIRLMLGGCAGITAAILSAPFWRGLDRGHDSGTAIAVLASLIILDWPARMTANRAVRVSPRNVISAFVVGLIASAFFEGNPIVAIAAVVGTAVAAGLVSGWNPRALRPAAPQPPTPQSAAPPPTPAPAGGAPVMADPIVPLSGSAPGIPPIPVPLAAMHRVPAGVRILWLGLFIGFATFGLALLATTWFGNGLNHYGAVELGFGVGLCATAAFCYRRSTATQFSSVWGYVLRPALQLGCIQALLVFGSLIIATQFEENGNALSPLIASIFPAIFLFVLTLHTRNGGAMSHASTIPPLPIIRPLRPTFTLTSMGFGVIRIVCALAGVIVLTAAMLLTAAVVSNLPGLWANGMVDPNFAQEMARNFGTRQWPSLIRHIGAVADFGFVLVATGLLLLSRRGIGTSHMFRGLLAVVLALAAAVAFGGALPDWAGFFPQPTPAATIEAIFQSIHLSRMLIAAGLTVLAGFVFLWPPKAHRPAAA